MLTETNHRSIFLPLLCFPPFLWHYVKWIINQTLDSEFWIIRLIFPSIWCLFCLRYDEKPRYELCDWWERESSVSNKILTRCWEEDVCLLIMYQQSGSDAAGLNINKKQTYWLEIFSDSTCNITTRVYCVLFLLSFSFLTEVLYDWWCFSGLQSSHISEGILRFRPDCSFIITNIYTLSPRQSLERKLWAVRRCQ